MPCRHYVILFHLILLSEPVSFLLFILLSGFDLPCIKPVDAFDITAKLMSWVYSVCNFILTGLCKYLILNYRDDKEVLTKDI